MDRCEVPAPLFQPGIDFTGTNLAQQPLGERMDFLVAARPQAAVLARIGVDKTLVSIEQEDPVMAIAARQISADFIVEPCFVAAPDALNRFVPKGHTLLLVQRTRDETVEDRKSTRLNSSH